MKHIFYKESDGRWYIDLPTWTGSKDDLEMVAGADIILNMLADGKTQIEITFSDQIISGYRNNHLRFVDTAIIDNTEFGAFYFIDHLEDDLLQMEIWLCDVVKFIFDGSFPKDIYFVTHLSKRRSDTARQILEDSKLDPWYVKLKRWYRLQRWIISCRTRKYWDNTFENYIFK